MKYLVCIMLFAYFGYNSIPKNEVSAQVVEKPNIPQVTTNKGYKQADENIKALLRIKAEDVRIKAEDDKKIESLEKQLRDRPVIYKTKTVIKEVPAKNVVYIKDSIIEVEPSRDTIYIVQEKPFLGIKLFKRKIKH